MFLKRTESVTNSLNNGQGKPLVMQKYKDNGITYSKTVDIPAETDLNNLLDEATEKDKVTFTAAELYALNTKEIPTLIEPIIPASGIWALAGGSDVGNSMLLRQLVFCLADGAYFLGWKINTRYGKAIFIATEDDIINTSWLIRKQALNISGLENIRFHFDTEKIPEYLDAQLTAKPADLVIIDAWGDVLGKI